MKSDKEDGNRDNSVSSNTASGSLEFKSEGDFKDDENCLKLDNNNDNNQGDSTTKAKKKRQNNNGNKKSGLENDTKNDTADDDDSEEEEDDEDLPESEIEVSSLPSPLFDLDDEAKEELADLSMMLHSSAPFAPHHHPHHPHHPHAHHHRGATAAAGVGGAQNYGGVNSAFHRQPSSGGFHHGHHQVSVN